MMNLPIREASIYYFRAMIYGLKLELSTYSNTSTENDGEVILNDSYSTTHYDLPLRLSFSFSDWSVLYQI